MFLSHPILRALLVLDQQQQHALLYKQYDSSSSSIDITQTILSASSSSSKDTQVLLADGLVAIHKTINDVTLCVVASDKENELILQAVLSGIEEALAKLLHGTIDRQALVQHLDLLMLVVDEAIDDGLILEIDPDNLASRASMRAQDSAASPLNLNEQTLKQALKTARDQMLKSFRQ
jgi:hypothetical protein